MRLRTFLAAALMAILAISVATAAPPPGKGKPDKPAAAKTKAAKDKATKGKAAKAKAAKAKAKKRVRLQLVEENEVLEECRPRVSYVLKGEFVSLAAGAEGSSLVAMTVQKANKHGRAFVGKQVSVTVGERTRVVRRGPAEASDLAAGDRLVVQVRGCKDKGESVDLYAKKVVARPAKGSAEEEDSTSTSTSTSTETETTGSTETETTESTTTSTTP